LGANFAPQSRDLAIPRERKPVDDFRRYGLVMLPGRWATAREVTSRDG
jgi:hypothetical protein